MEATAASRLPPLLTRFQQQCPQVDITLITQPTRQLTEGVLTAALECRAGLPAARGRWATGLSRRAGIHPGVL